MADDLSTRIVHAGRSREQGAPSAPPLLPAAVYTWAGDPAAAAYTYGRDGNAAWDALEATLGALEDAQTLVFASGMAAATATLLALLGDRKRLVLPDDGYYNVRKLGRLLGAFGVEAVMVDEQDADAVGAALSGPPAVLWVETPTNPFLRVVDLELMARVADVAGTPMVVDNTVATAALQRPLDHGATATVTSLTKAASGHSDLLLGAVASRDSDLLGRVRTWRNLAGGIAGPFEAWLAHRGLQTLPLRIQRQSETALALARHLMSHPRVTRVHYPGTEGSTLATAEKQMRGGFGPLLSFELDGDAAAGDTVVSAARLIRPMTSFGGVESSWERRARWASESCPEALIRLSVGLEAFDDLIADVDQALAFRRT
jgi:cystathionine beta-lyase/cystathionine gamma-synthase